MKNAIDKIFKDIPDEPLGFVFFLKNNLWEIYDTLNIKSVYLEFEIFNKGKNLEINELIYGTNNETQPDNAFKEEITEPLNYYLQVTYIPNKKNFSPNQLDYIKYINKNIFISFLTGINRNLKSKIMYTDLKFDVYNIPFVANMFSKLDDEKKNNYSMIGLDIKKLKNYNSQYGMETMDKILFEYCLKIKNFIDNDECIARPGGNYLIILLKDINIDKTLNFIKCISIKYKNNIINIENTSAIIKINKDSDIFKIVGIVLDSVNKIKQEGKSFIYIDHDIVKQLEHVKEIKYKYEKALKNEEFVVYYQPKVNSVNRRLHGAEALVRWVSDGQMIPPGSFIPILERENLIDELDYYVLKKTCEDIKNWIDLGITPVRISVNFARNHLRDSNFSDKILKIIDFYGVPHKYIEIELTETSIYNNFETLKIFVEKMSENNINVSIDDFGTGYSSLNFLKELDINTIKIDKTFIDNIYNEKNIIIISYMINMINDLNIEIVGEGIENLEQIEFLKNLGCCIIQGYYYDKPLPPINFKERLINPTYKK